MCTSQLLISIRLDTAPLIFSLFLLSPLVILPFLLLSLPLCSNLQVKVLQGEEDVHGQHYMTYYSSRPLVDLRASSKPAAGAWSFEPTLSLFCQLACQSARWLSILSVTETSMQLSLSHAQVPLTPHFHPPCCCSLQLYHHWGLRVHSSSSSISSCPARMPTLGCHPRCPPCMVSHYTAGALTHTQASQKNEPAMQKR